MSEILPLSLTQKGKRIKDIFEEVEHNETIGLDRKGELHLFHMVMHNNKFYSDDLQFVLRKNLARYAFSRAELEDFEKQDELEMAVDKAMRIMLENGDLDLEGTDNALSEIMVYAFLEEMLHAPKLMSRMELFTELAQFRSECKGIHLLSPDESMGEVRYQMVFGASHIVGDLEEAIDNAFNTILKIEGHESREIMMVQKTAMDRMVPEQRTEELRKIILPEAGSRSSYDTSYGVFLGYSLGLDTSRGEEFTEIAMQKMARDIQVHAPYIAQKIKDNDLAGHSFYFYVVPFNDAVKERHQIMEGVLRGGAFA